MIPLLLALLPCDPVLSESVDAIEINHRYDDAGRFIATQAIFWEWRDGTLVVRDWRNFRSERPRPTPDGWRLRFLDGDTMRAVDAPVFRETWTQYDPELEDRYRWDIVCDVFDDKRNPRSRLLSRPRRAPP